MKLFDPTIQGLRFPIIDTELSYAFSTQASVSFSVKIGGYRGWVDVHFPCDGHIKARVRGFLPDEYLESAKLRVFVSGLLKQLKIREETYEATFFKATNVIEFGKSVNREAVTDRIETERKFIPPD